LRALSRGRLALQPRPLTIPHRVYFLNHPEYDAETLGDEYNAIPDREYSADVLAQPWRRGGGMRENRMGRECKPGRLAVAPGLA